MFSKPSRRGRDRMYRAWKSTEIIRRNIICHSGASLRTTRIRMVKDHLTRVMMFQ